MESALQASVNRKQVAQVVSVARAEKPQVRFFAYGWFKPRLNDQTFSSNIMFVTQNVQWLNGQTMFDQTPFAAIFVFAKYVDVTQISFLIGCFFSLAQASLA